MNLILEENTFSYINFELNQTHYLYSNLCWQNFGNCNFINACQENSIALSDAVLNNKYLEITSVLWIRVFLSNLNCKFNEMPNSYNPVIYFEIPVEDLNRAC